MITQLAYKIALELDLAVTDTELLLLDQKLQDIGYSFYTGLQLIGVEHELADYILNTLF